MFKPWSGRLLAALLGACLCAPAALSQTKPAPAAAGPWAKVPALPTACYQDAFHEKLYAAQEAVNADLYKQQAINSKIKEAYQSIDPMEMATRMQQWMMANPEEAMAFMQATQSVGQDLPGLLEAEGAKRQALDAERDALFKRYETALAVAYAPADVRWKALAVKLGVPADSRSMPETGAPNWAYAEETAIRLQRDQLYQAFCPQWWGAAGPIHTFVKKYRTWLIQEHIPFLDKYDAQNAQTFAIMNTPAASYKSTSTLTTVVQYMQYIDPIFQRRIVQPICPNGVCPQGL
jgi:hypothetical protein